MPSGDGCIPRFHHLFLIVMGILVGATSLLGIPNRSSAASGSDAPKGIPIGIFRAHPEVTLVSRWEDNIYKTETAQKSDMIVEFKPVITLVTHWAQNTLTLSYGATIERYRALEGENNTDQQFNLDLTLAPSSRVEIDLGYAMLVEHDERGTPESTSSTIFVGPNRWLQHAVKGSTNLTFNRLGAELSLEHAIRTSTNNGQSNQDRYWDDGMMTLTWTLTARTELLTELGHKVILYDTSPLLDSTESRLLLGLTWQATGRTEGSLKMGAVTKKFKADPAKDSTEMTWESGIVWTPQERTKLTFSSHRNFQEGGDQAEHFVATKFLVDIKHDIRSNWSILSTLDFGTSVFEPVRHERHWDGMLGLEYRLRRWFVLSAEFAHKIKRSDTPDAGYDSNGVLLSLVGTL